MRRMILGLWYVGGKNWADDGYGNLTALTIPLLPTFCNGIVRATTTHDITGMYS